jgi:hypothetical protein
VKSLSGFIRIVSAEKVSYLLPQVIGLGKDPLAIVRCSSETMQPTWEESSGT